MSTPRRPWAPSLLLALAVAACAGPNPTGATRPGRSAAPATGPAAVGASPVGPGPVASGPIQPAPSLPPSSNPLGALVGQVRAPGAWLQAAGLVANHGAGILSNHGGGLVSNHGGGLVAQGAGLITNNGASYRLLADQADAAASGAVVELIDATGQAIAGANGQPLRARTNAEGVYAFAESPGVPARLRVRLDATHGDLEAFALPGVGRSDLNLVSSLVANHVMTEYVLSQSDPKGTLARLPAAVEAETRQKAEAALAAAGALSSLKPAEVARAVGAMRQADPTFDAQLEAVKRLLIPAGQFSFGSGQAALQVPLHRIGPMVAGPEGSSYLAVAPKGSDAFEQVWRLDAGGTLRLWVGGDAGRYGAIEGLATGPDGALYVGREAPYGMDRPLAERGTRFSIHRVEPTGQLTLLAEDEGELQALGWLPEAGLVAFSQRRAYRASTQTWPLVSKRLRALQVEGRKWQDLLDWDPAEQHLSSWGALNLALAPDGTAGLWALGMDDRQSFPKLLLQRIALPTSASPKGSVQEVIPPVGGEWLGLLADGRPLGLDAQKQVQARLSGGSFQALPQLQGLSRGPFDLARVLELPGSRLRFVKPGVGVMESEKGTAPVHVAGRAEAGGTDAAGQVILSEPRDLAVGPEGSLWLLDAGVLKRLPPSGGAEAVVPATGTAIPALPGKLAVPKRLLGLRPDGALLALASTERTGFGSDADPSSLIQRAPDGSWSVPMTAPSGQRLATGALAPNGGVLLGHHSPPFGTMAGGFTYLPPDGAATQAVPLNGRPLAFMSGATWDGRRQAFVMQAYVNQLGYQWWAWAPGGALQELPATPSWFQATSTAPFGPIQDAQGRLIWAPTPTEVRRDAGSDGPGQVLAGPGGAFFAGSGVDDGLRAILRLAWGPNGDLYLLDGGAKQVKRIPAGQL